ncbi:hypothetical protein WA171_007291, partial [Blastocystis sp. BT1]
MGRIGIDEKDIRTLIDNNLLESAEYWVSLWICEENLSSTELGKRYYVFGDCLLRLRKYSQAKNYFQLALDLISATEEFPDRADILFKLYQCEYDMAEDKEDRAMIRSCIYILEDIPESKRSTEIRSTMMRLYWSCNNYELAKKCALSVLKDQPLAIEAISILSRLNDFKGLKIVEQQTPPFPDSPIPAELMKAEYQQFSNPMDSLYSLKEVSTLLAPCPLLYQRIAQCYFSSHQLREAIHWYEMMRSLDTSNFFETDYILSIVISRVYSIELATPPPPSLLSLVSENNSLLREQSLQRFSQQSPFGLPILLLRCFLTTHQDLLTLETRYWNVLNYYPSYFSYSLLISFYLEESMYQKAMTLAQQIQKSNPYSFYANLLLAKTALSVNDNTRLAETLLKKCHEEQPLHLETSFLLAKIHYDRKEYPKAIEILSKVVSKDISPE